MYSLYLWECIIRLSQHYKGKAFQARLQEEGFTVSLSGAYYLIKKTGSIFDRPRSGQPKVLSAPALQQIDSWLTGNNEVTNTELV